MKGNENTRSDLDKRKQSGETFSNEKLLFQKFEMKNEPERRDGVIWSTRVSSLSWKLISYKETRHTTLASKTFPFIDLIQSLPIPISCSLAHSQKERERVHKKCLRWMKKKKKKLIPFIVYLYGYE
jgi:hypothetical protein